MACHALNLSPAANVKCACAWLQVLQEQLDARAAARAEAEEARARERAALAAEVARLQEAELRGRVEKQLKGQQLIADVRAFACVKYGETIACALGCTETQLMVQQLIADVHAPLSVRCGTWGCARGCLH